MAQQDGIIKFKGTIGDITFFKSKDGYLARAKGGVDANRIANDPSFQRTRENGAEFGRAGSAGKILRTAFKAVSQNATDSKTVSRITKQMLLVIQADAVSDRGKRNVLDGELELFEGFDFNDDGKLSTVFYASYMAEINRVTGKLTVKIPSFVPARQITPPNGATHCMLVAAAAEIDFESGTVVTDHKESADILIDVQDEPTITLECQVTANSTKPLFLVLGIVFSQVINGKSYPLRSGNFNGLKMVKVSGQ